VPTNTAYWSSNGRNVASWINNENIITNWTDDNFTLAEWTYATPPGTTFDGGSMQFTAPVDMYSSTDAYDRYLLFPRRNILSPINSITAIDWVNNGNQLIRWINESDYEFVWVTGNV
jgi:hypothetical protein